MVAAPDHRYLSLFTMLCRSCILFFLDSVFGRRTYCRLKELRFLGAVLRVLHLPSLGYVLGNYPSLKLLNTLAYTIFLNAFYSASQELLSTYLLSIKHKCYSENPPQLNCSP